ncbi:MAG: hypothetical protein ACI8RD_000500 [Bacillariaceae sp.]|jgi:hypothetical protein
MSSNNNNNVELPSDLVEAGTYPTGAATATAIAASVTPSAAAARLTIEADDDDEDDDDDEIAQLQKRLKTLQKKKKRKQRPDDDDDENETAASKKVAVIDVDVVEDESTMKEMTIVQLKEQLKLRGMKVSGKNKQELIDRLKEGKVEVKVKKELKGTVVEYNSALRKALEESAADAAAAGGTPSSSSTRTSLYNNDHVLDTFLKEYPEQEFMWMPVNKRVTKGRLSPQSGKVLEDMRQAYGSEDKAWNEGWRWIIHEHNHQWYPPAFPDEEAYCALVKRHSRGGKNKGSVSSGKVKEILEMIMMELM